MELFILKERRLRSSSFWKSADYGALYSERAQIKELFILKERRLWKSSFWNPSTLRHEGCFWHKRRGKYLGSRSRWQQEPGGSWIIGNFLICIISAITSRSVQFAAWRKITLEDSGVNGKNVLGKILTKQTVRSRSELIWPWTGTGNGLLCDGKFLTNSIDEEIS